MTKVLKFQSVLISKENGVSKTYYSNVFELSVLPKTVVVPAPFYPSKTCEKKTIKRCQNPCLLLFLLTKI